MRQRAHRIELRGHAPVQFLAAAGEHHVLRAMPDQVGGRADAVRRGRAGGGDRIAQAEDPERGRERSRNGRAHRARHHVRPYLAYALFAQQVAGLDLPLRRAAAGTGDHAGARMPDVFDRQAGIGDRIAHRHVGIRGRIAHEALEFAIDLRGQVNLRLSGDLAAQAAFDIIRNRADSAAAIAQRRRHRRLQIAQTRHDTHTGHDDTTHVRSPPWTGTDRRASRSRRRSRGRRRTSCRRRSPARACRASRGGYRLRSVPVVRSATPGR